MGKALAAVDAVVGLAQGRDGPVVTDEVGPLELPVLLLLLGLGIAAFRNGRVVVLENARDVDAPGARHAVLAVGAVHERVLLHLGGHALQEVQLFVGEGLEMRERLDVVQERVHRRHAAQGAQDARIGPAEAEGPGGDGLVGLALLHLGGDGVRHVGEAASEERLHDHDGDSALVQFGVEVVRIDVADPVGMGPVHVVHLDLDEVPDHLAGVVQFHEVVELMLGAVEGESEVPDPARFLFLAQEVDHAVLYVALLEGLLAAPSDGMEEVVVEIIGLELLEGVPVHPEGGLHRLVSEVGKLRRDEVLLPRMTTQGDARGFFRLPLQVGGGGVEVIDAVFDGIVHHLVHGFLVDDVFPVGVLDHGPAHAAEAQEGYLVPAHGILPVDHLLRALIGGRGLFRGAPNGCCAKGQRAGAR